MTGLSTEEILKDNKTRDPTSITSLSLTHKALTNVSCLSDFKNLERLDLTFNNLTSLKGLESCLNLKWLSVQQNKLQSLKGIEGLTNLTVLNAGKNKLRSMEEVRNLKKLRALILNDNDIASISGLDQLKELNTLVLSRNPIHKMGDSLAKLKSIAKISLSNCQLEAIDSSIKACTGLEQLRLAHNDIKGIPAELANNKRLQILDLGNNMISKWSDLEVLSTLRNLKNLNLLGNPIAEKAKLVKKISKLAPSLQILNAKRLDTLNKVEMVQIIEDAAVSAPDVSTPQKKKKQGYGEKIMNNDANLIDTKDVDLDREKIARELKVEEQKKKKKEKYKEKEAHIQEPEKTTDKRSKRKADKAGIDVIDDKETPFSELLAYDGIKNMKPERRHDQADGNMDSISGLVTFPSKKKKAKNQGAGASVLQFLTPAAEVGLGGPSAWDDD